jgi:hypothetical protein
VKRTPVKSTNLASVGYDAARSVLEIEFRNGHVYEYYDVPQDVYTDVLRAGSPGEFFTSHIMRKYRFRQLK